MAGHIKFEMLTEFIGKLTIHQPARRNALSAKMWADIPDVLATAAAIPKLRALIVAGEGEHFAAGADISEFETLYATPQSSKDISEKVSGAMAVLADFPMPTIAMIRGACVGGGCGLALCCDMRFADTRARFAITPARLGLVYPFADVQRLIAAVGLAHAKDILLSARLVKADEAKTMSLINAVYEEGDLNLAVMAYAEGLSALSPQSLRVTKQMFNAAVGFNGENSAHQKWFLLAFESDDFKEGYKAFLEKRKPDFR